MIEPLWNQNLRRNGTGCRRGAVVVLVLLAHVIAVLSDPLRWFDESIELPTGVVVDDKLVLLMHSAKDCTPDNSSLSGFAAELKREGGFSEIEALTAMNALGEGLQYTGGKWMRGGDVLRRREVTLGALGELLTAAHRRRRRQLSENGTNVDSDLGHGGAILGQTSKKYLGHMNIDVVADPVGEIGSRQLADLANLIPCLGALASPEVYFPREDLQKPLTAVGQAMRGVMENDQRRPEMRNLSDVEDGRVVPDDLYHDELYYVQRVGVDKGWARFSGSEQGMVIAVIDSGCSYHPDLSPNFWLDPDNPHCDSFDSQQPTDFSSCFGYDFGDEDDNPCDETLPHGTGVSGIIAAQSNNLYGVSGICWTCKIACLKVARDDALPLSALLAAYDFIYAKGIKIANQSAGGWGFVDIEYQAIKLLEEVGTLFVTSAGNDACNLDNPFSCGPASYRPAAYDLDHILSVGSSDMYDKPSYFSNYGRYSVDLFAPGSAIGVLQSTYFDSSTPGYSVASGTSFSSPIVAGIAALVWSANPLLTNLEVKERLLSTARLVDELTGLAMAGGIVDAEAALKDSALTDSPHSSLPPPTSDFTSQFYLPSEGMSARGASRRVACWTLLFALLLTYRC